MQQALTPEAANIVKQAVGLARRRGHAQVTPLHVASTMLSSSTGLLRTACLQSHSHPLQCKALELCFNVALNRLPASSSNPMLGHHGQQYPSLSNALVAAFKRAQAHQRRGSIENQQQPLLAVRVEVEQLVISILDDPSVSRVMREAGFSSTQVKSNVEKTVSTEVTASSPSSANKPSKQGNALINMSSNAATCPVICPSPSPHFGVPNMDDKATTKVLVQARSEDVMQVLQAMVNKRRRNTVVVGDCLASVEGLMRRAMEKVNKEEVGEELKNLQFISLPLFSFSHFSKEEVDQKLGEVRCIVKSCVNGRGAVLYVGDLEWIAEFQVSSTQQGRNYYCPVEHMVIELGRLVCSPESELGKLWLMGVATHQTYSKCKIGAPSLEIIWGLHPLIIAANNLSLNISADR